MKLTFGTILTLLWAFSSIKARPAGGFSYSLKLLNFFRTPNTAFYKDTFSNKKSYRYY